MSFPGPLTITIPGEPVGHGRPRAASTGGGRVRMFTDAKSLGDAGNGVLWLDDAQVWRGTVARVYGAQGEATHVRVFAFGIWQLDQLAVL